jgi:hypothetical protein
MYHIHEHESTEKYSILLTFAYSNGILTIFAKWINPERITTNSVIETFLKFIRVFYYIFFVAFRDVTKLEIRQTERLEVGK